VSTKQNKMPENELSRRDFLKRNSLASLAIVLAPGTSSSLFPNSISDANKPALLGGKPVLDTAWVKWPVWNPETDEKLVLNVLRSGIWSRDEVVSEFEKKWAEKTGMKRSVTTVNCTNAMILSLTQLGVGAGDEVLVSAYTFIATPLAILATGAMPVFVDTDPETFQLDTRKIISKITPRTRAILTVHLAGLPADMVRIKEIAKKYNLVVVEDVAQAHLAEIDHQKAGTWGDAGCFSFQNSKNLPIGEGGAIVSHDDAFLDRCYAYHNFGIAYGSVAGSGPVVRGSKLRLTEYQAAVGLVQMERIEAQTTLRSENAEYLRSQLQNVPGVGLYKLNPNVTRAVYHFFPFRYKKDEFDGLSRDAFMNALEAEGVPCFAGYGTLHDKPYIEDTFKSKNFRKFYSAKELDIKRYMESNKCPVTDTLCNEEAIWLTQNLLLSGKKEMDGIAEALSKVKKNASAIKKALSK
jgi:dTDP-4-amino-4,6-dideoxygalactose transaminase